MSTSTKKPTVAQCMSAIELLTERLDKAGRVVKAQQETIAELSKHVDEMLVQELKTKKQLRFLQKVAKGQIPIGSTPPAKANGESRPSFHPDDKRAF